jgi:hypothetical protein
MAARSRAGVPPTARWLEPRPHSRRDRRRRQIRPVAEALEGRLVLNGTLPTNPAPIGPQPDVTPNPGPAGVAYQQIVAVQTTTLQSLGDSYREVQASGAQFASRAIVAIDQLNAVLGQSQHEAHAIAAAIGRDRDLLDLGGADAAREEQGLDVARGLADQQANTDEIDIPNHLYTSLTQLVQQDQSTGTAISRSGRRSENAVVRELNKLGNKLTSTIPAQTPVRN